MIILTKLHLIILMTILVMAASCNALAEAGSGKADPGISAPKTGVTPAPVTSPGSPGNLVTNPDQRNSSLFPGNKPVSDRQSVMPADGSSQHPVSSGGSGSASNPSVPTHTSPGSPSPDRTGIQLSDPDRQTRVTPDITPSTKNRPDSLSQTGVHPASDGRSYPAEREMNKNLHYGPGTGTLLLSSIPAGASVTVDGAYRGKTPSSGYLEISDLDTGRHTILLSCAGYYDYSIDITISGNEVEAMDLVMTGEAEVRTVYTLGILEISSDPSGSDLFLDNEYMGITPLTLQGVSTGTHAVLVRKDGYSEYTGTVSVVSGQITAISAILTPSYGATESAVPQAPAATPVSQDQKADLPSWIPSAGLLIAALCSGRSGR